MLHAKIAQYGVRLGQRQVAVNQHRDLVVGVECAKFIRQMRSRCHIYQRQFVRQANLLQERDDPTPMSREWVMIEAVHLSSFATFCPPNSLLFAATWYLIPLSIINARRLSARKVYASTVEWPKAIAWLRF